MAHPRTQAEIDADIQRLLREKRTAEQRDRLQSVEARRARMGDAPPPSDGRLLAPPSPSPKRGPREGVPSGSSGRRTPASTQRRDVYRLPRFENQPTALADLKKEHASRLAPRHTLAPSSLVDAHHLARKNLKDADSRRGVAVHRSTAFNEAAPRRMSNPASTSTQPIPSYNAQHRSSNSARYASAQGPSSSSSLAPARAGSSYTREDRKGKSADRGETSQDHRQRGEEKAPATRHAWKSHTSATLADGLAVNGDDEYYSFEEEDGDPSKRNGENDQPDSDDNDDAYQDIPYKPIGNERNDDLTLVHRIRPGPKRFKALESDPGFQSVEPNSRIRLSKRILPHADLQEHLSDRFYLPHDILYSIVRPSKGGLEYEVPVEGDWIVIGVLAEKSEIKYTGGNGGFNNAQNGALRQMEMRKKLQEEKKAKARELAKERARAKFYSNMSHDGGHTSENKPSFDESVFEEMAKSDDELKEAFEGSDGEMLLDDAKKGKPNRQDREKQEQREEERSRNTRRRYMTFKLIDLGRKNNASSGTGILSLKLFESDPDLRRNIKSKPSDSEEEETEVIYNKKNGNKVLVTRSKKEKKLSKKKHSYNDEDNEEVENDDNDGDDDDTSDRFKRKEYRGGSGGAFEKFWKELNGTVVAVLNPRIMKPWQNPYMQNSTNANILSITPESADSVIVIGKSKDLGSCQAKKKDGTLCGSWCDTRIDNVCDYHIAQAVNRRRAGRAELLSGTGGMQTTHISGDISSLNTSFKNKPSTTASTQHSGKIFSGGSSYSAPYDPINKIGLLPRNNTSVQEGAKTYVVSNGPPGVRGASGRGTGGYLINAIGAARPMSGGGYRAGLTDSMAPLSKSDKSHLDPKEAAKKKKRELQSVEHLLAIEGGKSVGAHYLGANRMVSSKSLYNNKEASSSGRDDMEEDSASQNESDIKDRKTTTSTSSTKKKRVFGVDSLRKIGFDPTAMPAMTDPKQQKRKNDAIQALGTPETYEPKLGPHAGKTHSNVRKPQSRLSKHEEEKVRKNDNSSAEEVEEEGIENDEHSEESRRPIKRRLIVRNAEQDSGFQDRDSKAESATGNNSVKIHVARPSVPNVASEDEESDLEIEPPAAV